MRFILFVVTLALFSSCAQSDISKKLSGSDSLVVNFTVPNSSEVIKTVTATEANAIRRVKQFVDGKPGEEFKCGYDGNLVFFSKGEALLPIVFKYSEEGCQHFLFELDGKLVSTKMSNEAADFLGSLKDGRSYY
jgi:hypothetical protein